MKKYIVFMLVVLSLLALISCSEDQVLEQELDEIVFEKQNKSAAFLTFDEQLVLVAKEVSEFGGLFLDGSQLKIYIKGLDKLDKLAKVVMQDDVLAALENVLGQGINTYSKEVTLLNADYSILELAAWYEVFLELLTRPDVVFTDLSEGTNRLTVAYKVVSALPDIKAFLKSKGVPLEAVELEKSEAFGFTQTTLDDRIRPVDGGLRISSEEAACTHGFNVRLASGIKGFVTNSHCTDRIGSRDNTRFYQPEFGGGNRIGTEIADPSFFFSPNPNICPAPFECRYSDSALIRYSAFRRSSLGEIARPSLWGSLDINNIDPNYNIVETAETTLSGEVLMKVGQVTGKTAGIVDDTCIATDIGNGMLFLCQHAVNAQNGIGGFGSTVNSIVRLGDSGSPVFRLLPSPNPNHEVRLHGLLNGRSSDQRWLFSPYMNIYEELSNEVGDFVVN